MTEQTPSSPPGWYPDPQNPSQMRYWDGAMWTAVAPAAPAVPAGPTTSTNAIVALVLSIVSWMVCPIIAAIAALVLARSSDKEIAASGGRIGGSGFNTAARIISWINIGVSIAAGIVIAILAVFSIGFFASVASSLDPGINQRTGLADGDYVMIPERRVSLTNECSYGGPVFTLAGMPVTDTTVYGVGPAMCPNLVEVTEVIIYVDNGTAYIIRVE